MFHVKRSREGGDVSRETKEGGVSVSGGGLPSLPPADHAFSLFSFPHPPDPLPRGEGGNFCFILPGAGAPGTPATEPARHWFAGGAPPLASPGLNLRGAGSVGAGAPGTPAAKPGRHWLFLPRQCFSVPIPPTPFPRGEGGEIFGLFCRGLAPPAPLRLSPGGTGYFLPCQCFLPPSPLPPPSRREGGDQGYFMQGAPPLASPGLSPGGTGSIGGAGAPAPPAAKPAQHWLAGRLRPLHPRG